MKVTKRANEKLISGARKGIHGTLMCSCTHFFSFLQACAQEGTLVNARPHAMA